MSDDSLRHLPFPRAPYARRSAELLLQQAAQARGAVPNQPGTLGAAQQPYSRPTNPHNPPGQAGYSGPGAPQAPPASMSGQGSGGEGSAAWQHYQQLLRAQNERPPPDAEQLRIHAQRLRIYITQMEAQVTALATKPPPNKSAAEVQQDLNRYRDDIKEKKQMFYQTLKEAQALEK